MTTIPRRDPRRLTAAGAPANDSDARRRLPAASTPLSRPALAAALAERAAIVARLRTFADSLEELANAGTDTATLHRAAAHALRAEADVIEAGRYIGAAS